MKKVTLTLMAFALGLGAVNAQEKPYNKWSIDLNAGFAKPSKGLSPGFAAETLENLHLDGGVRYSINNKFGVKASFGYDDLSKWTNNANVKSEYYRTSLEGVVNLGRILEFENWTNTIGLQAHAGGGYSWLKSNSFSGNDNLGHIMAGLTAQVKLFPRVALNADFTVIQNIEQDKTFDGTSNVAYDGTFRGTMYNATLGLSIYLGKHKQHADWYSETSAVTEKIAGLNTKLDEIEAMLVDSDGDGIPDYLDLEVNTPEGALVDVKGRSIDKNNNGIADNIEVYITETYGSMDKATSNDSVIKDMINNGYVAVNFGFDKVEPTTVEGINFITSYLKNNPSATVEVNGYADSVGNKDYNQKLSTRRANAVKDILVKAGVSADRVSSKGNGIDSSKARNLARKVTFTVK